MIVIEVVSSRALALLASILLCASSTEARAGDDKAACIASHARGQELRLAGKLVEATKDFRACSAAGCPPAVTQDCTRWHDELRALTPSVLVVASAPDGSDTVDVRLVIDGATVAERLPTTSLELDPGEHTIRLEHAGWTPVEQRIVLREREKDRRVGFHFVGTASAAAPPAASVKSNATFGIVMLAIGGAATVTGATFGILGRTRETELADSPCGRNGTCATEDVDVVRQRYWVGGIAGGIGLAALAVGLVYFLTRDSGTKAAASSLGAPWRLTPEGSPGPSLRMW